MLWSWFTRYTHSHIFPNTHAHMNPEHLMSCGSEEGSENSVHLLWQEVNRSHIQACWRQSEPQEHLPTAHTHTYTAHTLTLLIMKHRCHDKHSFKSYTLPIHSCKITNFKYHHTLKHYTHVNDLIDVSVHHARTHAHAHTQYKHRLSSCGFFLKNMNLSILVITLANQKQSIKQVFGQ